MPQSKTTNKKTAADSWNNRPKEAVVDMGKIWASKRFGWFKSQGRIKTALEKESGIENVCEEWNRPDGKKHRTVSLNCMHKTKRLDILLTDEEEVFINLETLENGNKGCFSVYLGTSEESGVAPQKKTRRIQMAFTEKLYIGHDIEALCIDGHTASGYIEPVEMGIEIRDGARMPAIAVFSQRSKRISINGNDPKTLIEAVKKSPTPFLLFKALTYSENGEIRKRNEQALLEELDRREEMVSMAVLKEVSEEKKILMQMLCTETPVRRFAELTKAKDGKIKREMENRIIRVLEERESLLVPGLLYYISKKGEFISRDQAASEKGWKDTNEALLNLIEQDARYIVEQRRDERAGIIDPHAEAAELNAKYEKALSVSKTNDTTHVMKYHSSSGKHISFRGSRLAVDSSEAKNVR